MDAVVLSRLLNSRKPNEIAAARAAFAQAGPPAADIVASVLERAPKKRERRARPLLRSCAASSPDPRSWRAP